MISDFHVQYMTMLEEHRHANVPEDQTMEISKEAYNMLKGANIIKIGKAKSFGGYVVSTKKRTERKKAKKIKPTFKIEKGSSSK